MRKIPFAVSLILIFCLLFSWCSFAAPLTPVPHQSVQSLRQEISGILTDKRFTYPDYFAWWFKFWERVGSWIEQQIEKWRPTKKSPFDAIINKFWNNLGLLLLILLPVGLVFFLPRLFQKEKRLRLQIQNQQAEKTDASLLMAKAAALASQGLMLDAVHHIYLAGMEHFKKQGILQNSVNFSDKENLLRLRRSLGSDNQTYNAFAKLVNLFQEKWYGLKTCQSSDYDQALELGKIILESAGKINA